MRDLSRKGAVAGAASAHFRRTPAPRAERADAPPVAAPATADAFPAPVIARGGTSPAPAVVVPISRKALQLQPPLGRSARSVNGFADGRRVAAAIDVHVRDVWVDAAHLICRQLRNGRRQQHAAAR